MRRILILFCTIFAGSITVFSQDDGNRENWCRNGHFPRYENIGVGYIKAPKKQRVYFYSDDDDCPNGKNCRKRAYLVNGDEVLTAKTFGVFTCVWYQPNGESETVGWIPTKNLDQPAFLTDLYANWPGDWEYAGNTLTITKTDKRDTFKVQGNAFWRGLGDNIHIGEIDTTGVVTKDGKMTLLDHPCEIKLDLVIGAYLVSSDNLDCGGANVTFTGVYRKMKKAATKPKRP